MTITICASVDFTPKIIEIKKELESENHQVNIPYLTKMVFEDKFSYDEYLDMRQKQGGDIEIRKSQPVDFIKRY